MISLGASDSHMYENDSCVHRLLVAVERGKLTQEILASGVHHLCRQTFEKSALPFCWSSFDPGIIGAFLRQCSILNLSRNSLHTEEADVRSAEQIELLLQVVSGVGD